ncbi:MAG: hypothetical protein WCY27_04165 [archaeon]
MDNIYNPQQEQKLISIIKNVNYKIGSYNKLKYITSNLPQNRKQIKYLIAGSWGIAITTNEKIKHDDIDVILFTNNKHPLYIDDANNIEEKCEGPIPISKKYFNENHLIKTYKNKEIIVPTINFQICAKLIGQLELRLPKRAINQIILLLNNYNKIEEKNSYKEIKYILNNTTPKQINKSKITEKIITAIKTYKTNKVKSINQFIEIHKEINTSLREEFNKLD